MGAGADGDGGRKEVVGDDGAGSHHRAFPDFHTGQNAGASADKDARADHCFTADHGVGRERYEVPQHDAVADGAVGVHMHVPTQRDTGLDDRVGTENASFPKDPLAEHYRGGMDQGGEPDAQHGRAPHQVSSPGGIGHAAGQQGLRITRGRLQGVPTRAGPRSRYHGDAGHHRGSPTAPSRNRRWRARGRASRRHLGRSRPRRRAVAFAFPPSFNYRRHRRPEQLARSRRRELSPSARPFERRGGGRTRHGQDSARPSGGRYASRSISAPRGAM